MEAENTRYSPNQNNFSASNIQIRQGSIDIQAANAVGTLRNDQPHQITLTGSPVKFQQKVSEAKGMVYESRSHRLQHVCNGDHLKGQCISDHGWFQYFSRNTQI
ncbi:hypothetical protein ACI8B_110058 [Acinetobacter proteolyticus]|uniref:Uncharacterized protein n=1 Tax=Acinetobacter proteolyticus TaxID=1776741 RepID=A0A653K1G3_9GAMM|nr:hypothetical protein ACI8B_110058 [Acinetobacter proteolyticus]